LLAFKLKQKKTWASENFFICSLTGYIFILTRRPLDSNLLLDSLSIVKWNPIRGANTTTVSAAR
jgi:hypothetical protein